MSPVKTAEFTLEGNQGFRAGAPEVDAEFARAFGVEDGDVDKLHADIRANMEKEKKRSLKSEFEKCRDGWPP